MIDMTRSVNVIGVYLLLPVVLFLVAFVLPSLVFAPIAAVSIALLMFYLMYRFIYASSSRTRRNYSQVGLQDRLCTYVVVYLIGALAISIGF